MNTPQNYTKKPVTIQAIQWDGTNTSDITNFAANTWAHNTAFGGKPLLTIETPEGPMTAQVGDYIIKGIAGEFYPCRSDIFTQTYTPTAP